MKRLALLVLLSPLPAQAHPHIFVDVGLEVQMNAKGELQAVKVTWAYDALFSLLITEDYGMDPEGDAVLTPAEEAQLTGFDMRWDEGYNGDLVGYAGDAALQLSRPQSPTAVMREGRIVTTHIRQVAGTPNVAGKVLTFKPFDPTYYNAYDVSMGVTVTGLDGCMIGKVEPDMDKELLSLQNELARLSQDQDSIEMGFPEIGESFATTIEISCAGF